MRRQTELKTVHRSDTDRMQTVKRSTRSGSSTGRNMSMAAPRESMPVASTVTNPFREMERWFEESLSRPFFGMNWVPFRNLINDLGNSGELMPAVDMFEEGEHLVVKAELPGIPRDDLNLRIVDGNLIISGEKRSGETVERSNYLRLERHHGSFTRTLRLPDGLDTEHIRASFRDGILDVRIPKTESTVRQITVE